MDFLIKIFKALANENRVHIMNFLLRNGEKELTEVTNQLKLPYKTVARNLKILEGANLVSSRRWGGLIYYKPQVDSRLKYNELIFKIIRQRYGRVP